MNLADTNKLMYDFYLSDEESAGDTLLMVIATCVEWNDVSGFSTVAKECEKRGIDPVKAMEKAWKRQDEMRQRIWGRGPIPAKERK